MMTPRSVTLAFVCWGAAVAIHRLPIDEPSAGVSLQAASGGATRVLMEKESLYHYIRVTQTGNVRRLQFRRSGDDFDESAIDISDPLELPLDYYHVMLAGFAHQPSPKSVLFIGMGGGTLPMAVHHYFTQTTIDNVELDPEVVAVAKQYFGLKEDDRLKVFAADGRVQLRRFVRQKKQYDLIFLDAFRGGYIPYHLTTREFLQDIKKVLTPEGVVVSNLRPGFESYAYQRRTFDAEFRHHATYGNSGNLILVSDNRAAPLNKQQLRANAERLQAAKRFRADLPGVVQRGATAGDYPRQGAVLTDDFAPTDVLRGIPRE